MKSVKWPWGLTSVSLTLNQQRPKGPHSQCNNDLNKRHQQNTHQQSNQKRRGIKVPGNHRAVWRVRSEFGV